MNFPIKSNDVLHIARKINYKKNSKILMDMQMISIDKEIPNTYSKLEVS